MAKYGPAALVAALLVATGAAFVYTESLKLAPSPLKAVKVTRLFSPVCECDRRAARIAFALRKPDIVSVSIVDANGSEVRRLAIARPRLSGPAVFRWNGRDDRKRVVPPGSYQTTVRLDLAEKTVTLPNRIVVDTTAPTVTVVGVAPRVFSPDRDGRADRVTVTYRLDEPGRVELWVDGVRRVVGHRLHPRGELQWYGRSDGRVVGEGTHRLELVATDLAGNRTGRVPAGSIRIRYVALSRPLYRVARGQRFAVRIDTDAARVRWRLGQRTGTVRPPVLHLRAPDRAGLFRLAVHTGGHVAHARVIVR